jgi:hypothetical protein
MLLWLLGTKRRKVVVVAVLGSTVEEELHEKLKSTDSVGMCRLGCTVFVSSWFAVCMLLDNDVIN